jgi:hypothetical protein
MSFSQVLEAAPRAPVHRMWTAITLSAEEDDGSLRCFEAEATATTLRSGAMLGKRIINTEGSSHVILRGAPGRQWANRTTRRQMRLCASDYRIRRGPLVALNYQRRLSESPRWTACPTNHYGLNQQSCATLYIHGRPIFVRIQVEGGVVGRMGWKTRMHVHVGPEHQPEPNRCFPVTKFAFRTRGLLLYCGSVP